MTVVCVYVLVWTFVNVLRLMSVEVLKVGAEKNGTASKLRPTMVASTMMTPIRVLDGCIASDSPVATTN